MKSFCIRCSAPSGRAWQVWDFIFSSCRDSQSFFHTLGLSPSLPPFFLLSGLLCKSQLAGPWCTGGLKQEAHFCPSLPLFYGHNFPGCCARTARHSSLTIIAIAITKSSRWHRGNTGEKQKWGQNGRGKNNSLFIAHLHHQQKSHSFLVWDSARLIKNCFCTPPTPPGWARASKTCANNYPKNANNEHAGEAGRGFLSAGFPPHLWISSSSSSSSSPLQRESAVDLCSSSSCHEAQACLLLINIRAGPSLAYPNLPAERPCSRRSRRIKHATFALRRS